MTTTRVITDPGCQGAGKPLVKLGPRHYTCPDCWRHWQRANIGPRKMEITPRHGYKYEYSR